MRPEEIINHFLAGDSKAKPTKEAKKAAPINPWELTLINLQMVSKLANLKDNSNAADHQATVYTLLGMAAEHGLIAKTQDGADTRNTNSFLALDLYEAVLHNRVKDKDAKRHLQASMAAYLKIKPRAAASPGFTPAHLTRMLANFPTATAENLEFLLKLIDSSKLIFARISIAIEWNNPELVAISGSLSRILQYRNEFPYAEYDAIEAVSLSNFLPQIRTSDDDKNNYMKQLAIAEEKSYRQLLFQVFGRAACSHSFSKHNLLGQAIVPFLEADIAKDPRAQFYCALYDFDEVSDSYRRQRSLGITDDFKEKEEKSRQFDLSGKEILYPKNIFFKLARAIGLLEKYDRLSFAEKKEIGKLLHPLAKTLQLPQALLLYATWKVREKDYRTNVEAWFQRAGKKQSALEFGFIGARMILGQHPVRKMKLGETDIELHYPVLLPDVQENFAAHKDYAKERWDTISSGYKKAGEEKGSEQRAVLAHFFDFALTPTRERMEQNVRTLHKFPVKAVDDAFKKLKFINLYEGDLLCKPFLNHHWNDLVSVFATEVPMLGNDTQRNSLFHNHNLRQVSFDTYENEQKAAAEQQSIEDKQSPSALKPLNPSNFKVYAARLSSPQQSNADLDTLSMSASSVDSLVSRSSSSSFASSSSSLSPSAQTSSSSSSSSSSLSSSAGVSSLLSAASSLLSIASALAKEVATESKKEKGKEQEAEKAAVTVSAAATVNDSASAESVGGSDVGGDHPASLTVTPEADVVDGGIDDAPVTTPTPSSQASLTAAAETKENDQSPASDSRSPSRTNDAKSIGRLPKLSVTNTLSSPGEAAKFEDKQKHFQQNVTQFQAALSEEESRRRQAELALKRSRHPDVLKPPVLVVTTDSSPPRKSSSSSSLNAASASSSLSSSSNSVSSLSDREHSVSTPLLEPEITRGIMKRFPFLTAEQIVGYPRDGGGVDQVDLTESTLETGDSIPDDSGSTLII